MSKHLDTGQLGEALARTYLEEAGYVVEATGFRYRRVEIDLIVKKEDCLIFVEVKTRRGLGWGHPSAAVTPAKERNIAKAASAYMRKTNHTWEVRFDIISILLRKDGTHSLEHIEDAFFPGLF
ncbi:MAG: YraN family protein [Bacteroidota bacterium]